jgi:hypothetical protein
MGRCSSRKLPSIKNRDTYVDYVSEIRDSGHGYPLFVVTPEDDPEHPFVEKTSSSASRDEGGVCTRSS